MKKQEYTVTITVSKSPAEVFKCINDVSKWWPEDVEGESSQLNDELIFRSGDSHYSKNEVVEWVPNKKVVWLVTESIRKTDNFEWTGTKMIFELTPTAKGSLLKFTYDGFVPENESERLSQICDIVIKEKLYNLIESFTVTIEVIAPPQDVFKSITNDVAKWWGDKDLLGSSKTLNDEFIINHPGTHYSKQKLIEVIPNKKIVWLVTESTLNWLQKDQHEWENTKMIFEILNKGDKTVLHFTHEGLVPEKECYALCHEGWNTVIKDYLFHFITTGKPHF